MALAYVKPGVSVSEVVNTAFAPITVDPTSICIIGPAQGYETFTETVVLQDNHPYTLAATNPNVSTISVVDASNVTLTPFTPSANGISKDYDVDTSALSTQGTVAIKRSMQTAIADNEKVTAYYENSATPAQSDGKTEFLSLNDTVAVTPANVTVNTQTASLKVSKAGLAPAADYTLAGAGTSNVTIVWKNTATVLGKFQTLYIDYTVGGVTYTDQAFQLNNLTTVSLPANSTGHVVKTQPGASTVVTASLYQLGTGTTLDYIVTGTGTTLAIARSAGTTTIGTANDALAVRISYNATPTDYFLPTRCFSQYDVEDKYGPAFDSQGNIINPVTLGAQLVFEGGAPSVVVQALYSVTNGVKGTPTGALADWTNTLIALRDIEDVNVIVPLIQTGGLTNTDALNLQILEACQDHCNYAQQNLDRYVVMIAGEDATQTSRAAMATLRTHAQALAARNIDETANLLSPGDYKFSNPITGNKQAIGGQYAACVYAGTLARYPVQASLTRKPLNSLLEVGYRSEADKNLDANAGLTVIESNRGRVRVRHAITVSRVSREKSELSVVRAKYFIQQVIRETLDDQVIGQVILDANGTFTVQLVVQAALEQLVADGVLVSYDSVQSRRNPTDPTQVDVRFSYLPAYTLNNVNLSFAINQATGVTFSTQTTQTQGI